jgi:hypothetical protein
MATKSKRIRDFKQEYLARIARGLASGKSRSQARGHARASDLPHASPLPFKKENWLEKALKLMKQGATQKQAAKSVDRAGHTGAAIAPRSWTDHLCHTGPRRLWIL